MNIKDITYQKGCLTENDVMSKSTKTIVDLIHEAKIHALHEGIKANTILINQNLVKTDPFEWCGCLLPTMICGMDIYWTKDELPDNYPFAIFESPTSRDERLAKFELIGMEPDELAKAAKLYRLIKGNIE